MSRFADVITLRGVTYEKVDGVMEPSVVDTQVFFNRYSVGLNAQLMGRAEGLRNMASGAVRSIDYDGQELAVLDGIEYTVEGANNQGEMTVLTLVRRLAND